MMFNISHTNDRDCTIDTMKGITILLMIYAHVSDVDIVNRMIFSFHMPLFFILGGYLSKDVSDCNGLLLYTGKNARRLLIPYFVTMLLICLWVWRFEILKLRFNLTWHPMLNLFWGSGDMYDSQYGRLYVGPLWFLFAMFVCREFFYLVQCIAHRLSSMCIDIRIIVATIVILLSLLSVWLYPYLQPMAWNMIPGIAAMIFYMIGWLMRQFSMPLWPKILSLACWLAMILLHSNMDMRICEYGIWPINVIGACGGTWLVHCISDCLNNLSKKTIVVYWITRFLIWCGMSSLALLCMHSMDLMGGVSGYFLGFLGDSLIIELSSHFAVPLLLVWGISKIGVLRKIYF